MCTNCCSLKKKLPCRSQNVFILPTMPVTSSIISLSSINGLVYTMERHCVLGCRKLFHVKIKGISAFISGSRSRVVGLDRPRFEFRKGELFFFSPNRPHWPWGATCLLFNGPRCSSPVLKRPGREVNHSHHPSAEVKNEWS